MPPAAKTSPVTPARPPKRRPRRCTLTQDRWQGRLQKVTSQFKYFGPLGYNAVYWYTIEKIAEQLKSGELINPAIYVFNPDVVYDPQRKKKKLVGRPTGIPPPRK